MPCNIATAYQGCVFAVGQVTEVVTGNSDSSHRQQYTENCLDVLNIQRVHMDESHIHSEKLHKRKLKQIVDDAETASGRQTKKEKSFENILFLFVKLDFFLNTTLLTLIKISCDLSKQTIFNSVNGWKVALYIACGSAGVALFPVSTEGKSTMVS